MTRLADPCLQATAKQDCSLDEIAQSPLAVKHSEDKHGTSPPLSGSRFLGDADLQLLLLDLENFLDHDLLRTLPLFGDVEMPPEEFVDVVGHLVQGILQLRALLRVDNRGPHVNIVIGLKLRLLAELLNAIRNISAKRHAHQVLVWGEVQDRQRLGISVGIKVRICQILDDPSQRHLLRSYLISADRDGAFFLELGQRILVQLLHGFLNLLHIRAQLFTQDLEVGCRG
mmetsp:Transcript_90716/g.259526  ORF Transcript_90716/g.259526 Transcript_90716/m.259526 type:complete len:228 (-) Transcript_90716:2308-2991(-)